MIKRLICSCKNCSSGQAEEKTSWLYFILVIISLTDVTIQLEKYFYSFYQELYLELFIHLCKLRWTFIRECNPLNPVCLRISLCYDLIYGLMPKVLPIIPVPVQVYELLSLDIVLRK